VSQHTALVDAWLELGNALPADVLRLVLTDVDGVITRGEGQPIDLGVLARLAEVNRRSREDPLVPAITLCTGRQAPYVELMAQLVDCQLPCIFEHGAGLFFPKEYRFDIVDSDLAGLKAMLREAQIVPQRAFVQPGKEASMSLYPLDGVSLDALCDAVAPVVAGSAFDLARNVRGLELRPRGIDKGVGARRIAEYLGVPLAQFAGVGDSDPDLSYLQRVGFSAAPSNATAAVLAQVDYVATRPFGEGLLEIVTLVEHRNREHSLTNR
jgi:hydroxymethylpyrimidine pyrophosphatase-like HAD family hydrolase